MHRICFKGDKLNKKDIINLKMSFKVTHWAVKKHTQIKFECLRKV